MQKNALKLFVFFVFLFSSLHSFARVKVTYGEKEVLEKVADLPNSPDYAIDSTNKKYVDVGRIYTKYIIAGIPIYITKEPKIVGISDDGKTYYEIPDEEMKKILLDNHLEEKQLLKLGFFNRIGGKIIAILLICLMIYGILPKKNKKVEPTVV